MDRLENRWPFSDTYTSQSANTKERNRPARKQLRCEDVSIRSAGSADRDVSTQKGRNRL
jgi:hypothetical protein